MTELPRRYWFRAKAYGWGWGLPLTWEGWAVLGLYACAMMGMMVSFPPQTHIAPFVIGVSAITGLLVLICWRTGETPNWRWGK